MTHGEGALKKSLVIPKTDMNPGQTGGGGANSTQHHQEDGPASSLEPVSMGTEQCVVVSLLKLKLWLKPVFFLLKSLFGLLFDWVTGPPPVG